MPADLLFEIGCEEIPAKMLARALIDLPALVETRLAAARLAHAGIRALGTPRRLAVIVTGVVDRQPDLDEEVVGPPVGAAFAADGTVTKAGQGFAAKNGVAPGSLVKKEVAGKKGQYVVAQRHVAGAETRALLPAMLAELITAIPWPKSQRWGWTKETFVRPVQWLVALFGGEVVPVEFAGIASGRTSRGHRFLHPGGVEIASAAAYAGALHAAHVAVDPAERSQRVRDELARLEKETGLRVRPDDALVAEVIHLGEWPTGVVGGFDPSFLEVPEEIIVTAMRNHQRYFAMEGSDGKLAPRFATMMATVVKDVRVVASGNEKVIASRLSDAKFFFGEDRKQSFDAWNTKLEAVVFQAKLGERAKTIGQKVQRLIPIAQSLAQGTNELEVTGAAALFCKADLASKAVGEFPELQGTMGRHYAHAFGFSSAVGQAIEEHYLPKGQGGELPKSIAGAAVAIADRADTLVGCFAAGLEPSGSADPLGLRRAAIGMWQLLLARDWFPMATQRRMNLERGNGIWYQLLQTTARELAAQGQFTIQQLDDRAPWVVSLEKFVAKRLQGILVDQGIPAQDADAAIAQDYTDPVDARARALACAKISKEAREVFKRVANILDDARAKKIALRANVEPKLFVAPDNVEHRLYTAVKEAQERETPLREHGDYAAVFESLESLRPTVAAFFDKGGVMVMDPDESLRDNRLGMLFWFITPYMQIADFRLLGAAS